jgi:hypothetical protein
MAALRTIAMGLAGNDRAALHSAMIVAYGAFRPLIGAASNEW